MLGFLKKGPFRAAVEPVGVTFEVKAGQKLLDAALAAGIAWPHDCRVGSCGTCRCRLKAGRIKPLTDFAYTLDPAALAAGSILACQSLLRTDVELELGEAGAWDPAAVEWHEAVIARTRPLTHDILEVVASSGDSCFARARAGQYAELEVPAVPGARSYSFARAPELAAPGEACFYIRHVPGGAFTDWLFATDRTGQTLRLSGPYGSFYQRPGAGAMVCVAGGSGLAPIKALLEAALAARERRAVLLFFGARTRRDLYCLAELEALAARWAGDFRFVPVLSEEPADSGWTGERGLVTEAIGRHLESPAGAQGYLCGPPAMVDAGLAALEALGVPPAAMFHDKFLDASTRPREIR